MVAAGAAACVPAALLEIQPRRPRSANPGPQGISTTPHSRPVPERVLGQVRQTVVPRDRANDPALDRLFGRSQRSISATAAGPTRPAARTLLALDLGDLSGGNDRGRPGPASHSVPARPRSTRAAPPCNRTDLSWLCRPHAWRRSLVFPAATRRSTGASAARKTSLSATALRVVARVGDSTSARSTC